MGPHKEARWPDQRIFVPKFATRQLQSGPHKHMFLRLQIATIGHLGTFPSVLSRESGCWGKVVGGCVIPCPGENAANFLPQLKLPGKCDYRLTNALQA